MASTILISMLIISQAIDLNFDRFMSMVKEHQAFDTISFVYEGEVLLINENQKPGTSELTYTYRGVYSIRSDNARFMDVYLRDNRRNKLEHNRYAVLNGTKKSYRPSPGENPTKNNIHAESTNQMENNASQNPENYFYLAYFPMFKIGVDVFRKGYSFEGVENIDQLKCFKIRMDFSRGTPQEKTNYTEYWIDPERGYQVVKSVNYMFGGVSAITDQYNLNEFKAADGKTYWFPTSARKRTFIRGLNQLSKEPVFTSTLRIVRDTLAINKPYDDKYFTIFSPLAVRKDQGLIQLEKEFQSSTKTTANRNEVQETLEDQVKEADLQKNEIQAISPSQNGSKWFSFSSLFIFFGAATVLLGLLTSALKR